MTDTCPHCDEPYESKAEQVDHVHDEHHDVLEDAYFGDSP